MDNDQVEKKNCIKRPRSIYNIISNFCLILDPSELAFTLTPSGNILLDDNIVIVDDFDFFATPVRMLISN